MTTSGAPCPTPGKGPAVQDGHGATKHVTKQGSTGSGNQPGSSTSTGTAAPPSPSAPPTHNPSPSPTPRVPAPQSAAAQVLALINQARAAEGLPPYILSTGLDSAAVNHDLMMSDGCGLAHRCKNEPGLGRREALAGVNWTQAGENIGEGPAVTEAQVTAEALGLTRQMLNEVAPNDGHRQNILSRSFRYIGIAVIKDSTGTIWMTQDFSN